jgi:threonine dehydrogenase-like Zn-dependent dehydrogenase
MMGAALVALEKFEIREYALPEPGDFDVIVKTSVTGICTSDVSYATVPGQLGDDNFPRVLGHETAGWVWKVGKKVADFVPGLRVVVDPVQSDPSSYYVERGEGNLDLSNVTGISYDGGFGQYFRSHRRYVHALPESISFEQAASIEPAACSIHAVDMTGVRPGESVVILGDGPTGILMTQLAHAEGAGAVFLIGAHDFRLERARSARAPARGPDFVINARDARSKYFVGDAQGIARFIAKHNRGMLPRRVVVTARGDAQKLGWELGGPGARVVFFNLPKPDDAFTIQQLPAMLLEKQYRQAWLAPGDSWPRTIAHLRDGKLDVGPIQTHKGWELAKLHDGILKARDGKEDCIKVMFRLAESF